MKLNDFSLKLNSIPNKNSPSSVTLKRHNWHLSYVSQSLLFKVIQTKLFLFGIEYRNSIIVQIFSHGLGLNFGGITSDTICSFKKFTFKHLIKTNITLKSSFIALK